MVPKTLHIEQAGCLEPLLVYRGRYHEFSRDRAYFLSSFLCIPRFLLHNDFIWIHSPHLSKEGQLNHKSFESYSSNLDEAANMRFSVARLLLFPILASAVPTPQGSSTASSAPVSPGLGVGSLIHVSYAQFYTDVNNGSLNFKYSFWDQINVTSGNTCFYTSCDMPFPYAKLDNSTGTPKYNFTANSTDGAVICDPTRPHMGVNFTDHAFDNGFDLHFLHTVHYANTDQVVQRDASIPITSIDYLLPSTVRGQQFL